MHFCECKDLYLCVTIRWFNLKKPEMCSVITLIDWVGEAYLAVKQFYKFNKYRNGERIEHVIIQQCVKQSFTQYQCHKYWIMYTQAHTDPIHARACGYNVDCEVLQITNSTKSWYERYGIFRTEVTRAFKYIRELTVCYKKNMLLLGKQTFSWIRFEVCKFK